MANECVTYIHICGASSDLAELRALYPFNPAAIVPRPPHPDTAAIAHANQINACRAKTPCCELAVVTHLPYDWRIAHWGTTGVYETTLLRDESTQLWIRMHTPWSPASGVLKTLSERFPELEFAIVAHDIDAPLGLAWRYVAGILLDGERWDHPELPDDDCSDWVREQIAALGNAQDE